MADLLSLLSRGYFPKELPPPFKTVAFGQAVAAATNAYCDPAESSGPAKLSHHSLARPGNIHRRLGIPSPAKHVLLGMLIRYRAGGTTLDVDRIANALATIINHHAPLGNGSEVA